MNRLVKSLRYALNGFASALRNDNNFRIMLLIALLTITAMFYFPTEKIEKIILLVMIFAVLSLELINSVIERIMNFIHREHNENVRDIKDVMAAIVLWVSLGSAIIGIYILLPYILS